MERKPFESSSARLFFAEWCSVNDSIVPEFIEREDWEKREGGILEKREGEKQTLYLPLDLQLWEMVGVMEKVDKDTFPDDKFRRTEKKEELLMLAETFQNAGAYIAQREDSLKEGKEVAHALAEEFYQYGKSLELGEHADFSPEELLSRHLTKQNNQKIDRFLAGEELYASRLARAEDGYPEKVRRDTLAQFFHVAEKAFQLRKQKREKGPEKTFIPRNEMPIHSAFIDKIEGAIGREVSTPERALDDAFWRRGLHKLAEKAGVSDCHSRRLLLMPFWEYFGFSQMKDELQKRKQEGDMERVAEEEREIAREIQQMVSTYFPYEEGGDSPSKILETLHRSCLGASIIGVSFLKEAGANCLVGAMGGHSFLLLATSNGSIEWFDMQAKSSHNERLTDGMIIEKKKDGTALTVSDIATFAKEPTPEGLSFYIPWDFCGRKYWWAEGGKPYLVSVFGSEYGIKIQKLTNLGIEFSRNGQNEEALEAYKKALELSPKYVTAQYGLGNTLSELGRTEEAVVAYKKAMELNPVDVNIRSALVNVLLDIGRKEEAVEVCKGAIENHLENFDILRTIGENLLDLKRYEEAVDIYKKALSYDYTDSDAHYELGRALSLAGRTDDAIDHYEVAAEFNPTGADTRYALGLELKKLGRNEEAVTAFQEFIKLADPKEHKDQLAWANYELKRMLPLLKKSNPKKL